MPMILLPLVALAATAEAPPPKPAQPEQAIIITGRSLTDTERALRDCLARKCPPNEDIDAALGHAENLFVAGKYNDARRVTLAAIGRNARYRKTYPVDVSDLYRANARIAEHLGEGNDFAFSTTEMHRTLSDAFPKADPRVIDADLEWADMYAAFGRIGRSRQVFKEAERAAEAGGRPDLAGIARVREAWLYMAGGDPWLARQALEKLAADRSPSTRLQRVAALVLLARLDRSQGKTESSNTLVEELHAMHTKQPLLLFAPKIDLSPRLPEGDATEGTPNGGGGLSHFTASTTTLMPTDNFDDRWVDIGFWITPDGNVRDPEILRSRGPTDWTKQLLASVSGRVYSPTDESGGSYHVERYSYTSRWMNITGTRIRQRSPNARIEYVDLTPDQPARSQ
jgi:tetratricopeptide (TPR) repeat protein